MIEMHEDEYSTSDFTDQELLFILDHCGPAAKDALLHPPVPIEVVYGRNIRGA